VIFSIFGCFEFFYRDQFTKFVTGAERLEYLPVALPVLQTRRLQGRLPALRVALHDPSHLQALQHRNHHVLAFGMSD
jgi:hypothetical protein